MTTDARPPQTKDAEADTEPSDPPVYREASTPEEVDGSKPTEPDDHAGE
jgi:hypothetical protein